jgi:uncharacterized protein YyaL (SSP411 family)
LTEVKIKWLPWTEESFRKAKDLDKPILLGISAVWCHWCHVMDRTTYSDNEVASLVEEKFVPIKVDRDQRPDIDKRYNMGGWPSTAFLTSDGDILTGGTYIPPHQMKLMLEHVSSFYQKHKNDIKSRIKDLKKEVKKPSVEYGVNNDIFNSVIDSLTLAIASRFDSMHGGFGNAPKFPHSEALRFVLLQHHLHRHKAALNIMKKTLEKMRAGSIYDEEEGGFFRYSTTRDWSIPHYEKLCEDNAKLLINYLEAYQFTGEKEFRDTSKGIITYINSKLSDQKNGGFYGSQDADEAYYKLSLSERLKRTPPSVDKRLFVNWNCMMSSAYLLASVVLDEPPLQDFALRTVNMILDIGFCPENGAAHYLIEGKSYLSGLLTDQVNLIKCLIDCYHLASDRKFLDWAENLVEFMLNKLWSDSGGFYDKPKETDTLGALKLLYKPLEENSMAADALLRLYHLTGKEDYLTAARKWLDSSVSSIQFHGITASVYGLAIEMYLHPMQVHIVGSKNDHLIHLFLKESLKAYNPLKVVEIVDPTFDIERLKSLGYPGTKLPIAYVCSEGKCKSVKDPEKIGKMVS